VWYKNSVARRRIEGSPGNEQRRNTSVVLAKLAAIRAGAKNHTEVDEAAKKKVENRIRESRSVSRIREAIKGLREVGEIIEREHDSVQDGRGEDMRVTLKHRLLGFVSVQCKSSKSGVQKFIDQRLKNANLPPGVVDSAQSPLVEERTIVLCGKDSIEAIRKEFLRQLDLIEIGWDMKWHRRQTRDHS